MSDDDGHDYIVEVGKETAFDSWVESGESGGDFEFIRCSHAPICYTFTNPKVECS
jgi:hypothetical protein